MRTVKKISIAILLSTGMVATNSFAACSDVSEADFIAAAKAANAATSSYGFGLPSWQTMVDESGVVCYVYSELNGTDANQGALAGNNAWLGSRVISAQKANTANAFSLNGLSIPTGAISATVYPGGSLYGLQHSNPVDTSVAYNIPNPSKLGTGAGDPMVGKRIGGVNVFGGGIALYKPGPNGTSIKVGAIGSSGDTSCRDAALAYTMRHDLGLDATPNPDVLHLVDPPSALFQQPTCGVNDPNSEALGVVTGL